MNIVLFSVFCLAILFPFPIRYKDKEKYLIINEKLFLCIAIFSLTEKTDQLN